MACGRSFGSCAREAGWTVALLNDRGERRATGSYYTPDFVVKHIVEATVGPLLREAEVAPGIVLHYTPRARSRL